MMIVRFVSAVALTASVLLGGCAKEEPQNAPVALPHFTVEKGLIHFASKGDYETMVNMPVQRLQEAFLSKVRENNGFTSAESSLQSGTRSADADLLALIDDPYFRELLNDRLCIWIGDHIFRVNPEDDKVYVIEADRYDEKYAALLQEDVQDEEVKAFSTDVNVLEEVDRDGALWPLCTEWGAPAEHVQKVYNDGSDKVAYVKYLKYGLYFKLFAGVQPEMGPGAPFDYYFKGGLARNEGFVHYRQKCGNTNSYFIRIDGGYVGSQGTYLGYQGTKGLNQIYFRWRPHMDDCPDYHGPSITGSACEYPFLTNEWVGIRRNC